MGKNKMQPVLVYMPLDLYEKLREEPNYSAVIRDIVRRHYEHQEHPQIDETLIRQIVRDEIQAVSLVIQEKSSGEVSDDMVHYLDGMLG